MKHQIIMVIQWCIYENEEFYLILSWANSFGDNGGFWWKLSKSSWPCVDKESYWTVIVDIRSYWCMDCKNNNRKWSWIYEQRKGRLRDRMKTCCSNEDTWRDSKIITHLWNNTISNIKSGLGARVNLEKKYQEVIKVRKQWLDEEHQKATGERNFV